MYFLGSLAEQRTPKCHLALLPLQILERDMPSIKNKHWFFFVFFSETSEPQEFKERRTSRGESWGSWQGQNIGVWQVLLLLVLLFRFHWNPFPLPPALLDQGKEWLLTVFVTISQVDYLPFLTRLLAGLPCSTYEVVGLDGLCHCCPFELSSVPHGSPPPAPSSSLYCSSPPSIQAHPNPY